MTPPAALLALCLMAGEPPAADDAVQDLVILGESRPILVRLRATVGDKAFRTG